MMARNLEWLNSKRFFNGFDHFEINGAIDEELATVAEHDAAIMTEYQKMRNLGESVFFGPGVVLVEERRIVHFFFLRGIDYALAFGFRVSRIEISYARDSQTASLIASM